MNKTLKVVNGIPYRDLMNAPTGTPMEVKITSQRLAYMESALISKLLVDMPSSWTIHTIDLSYNKFNFRALDVLMLGLTELPVLEKLNFSGNKIGLEGAEAIAYYLLHNKSLRELTVVECDLCNDGMAQRGVEAIEYVMTLNKTLTELKLADNGVMPSIRSRITDSLKVNRSLRYDSHDEFAKFVTGKLPEVPVFQEFKELVKVVPYDEKWLRKENVKFRQYVIEPEVEVVRKKKKNVAQDRPPEMRSVSVKKNITGLLQGKNQTQSMYKSAPNLTGTGKRSSKLI